MVVTKADVYESVIFAERPTCPHCGQEMKILECIDTGLSCGSGWGTPYLFICVNDECPPFVNGWETMKQGFGRRCSYRCICFPGGRNTDLMMVASRSDGKSQVLEEAVIRADRDRGTLRDPEVKKLISSFESGDLDALLSNLFDEKSHHKVREKAAELIGELGLLEAIEPLRHHPFKDQRVAARVGDAILRICEVTGTRECPYCKEMIEAGAAVCTECGKDLSESTHD